MNKPFLYVAALAVGLFAQVAAAQAAGEALVEATVADLAQFFADFASAQLRVGT